ncbi:exonuclease domain-containing protein, partial [Shewanella morhuae]|uniref:exonuclease domain-containing protein n=1 Tax=Shewanella morhuae TaxID=365591 RepID=UPI0035AB79E5
MGSEIVEISIIDAVSGEILLDTLVKPVGVIPDDVIAIHGITNEMVADAPYFNE